MECQTSDSKKLFKVFDASKRKRVRKKREGQEVKSLGSDGSASGCQGNVCCVTSAKASLQDVSPPNDGFHDSKTITSSCVECSVNRDSSPALSRSPDGRRSSRSPRRHHRRPARDGISLALKAGLVSTPRILTPPQNGDAANESVPQDHDSFIYAFLEEAIKRDKKKHRHERKHEERSNREREAAPSERHHRRRHDHSPREHDKHKKVVEAPAPAPAIDQAVLFETFAKLCATLNKPPEPLNQIQYTHSHKSLQCEVVSRPNSNDVDHRLVKLRSNTNCRENLPRIRTPESVHGRVHSHDNIAVSRSHIHTEYKDKCAYCGPYDKDNARYRSKLDITRSRMRDVEDDRYREYPARPAPTKSCLDYRMQKNDLSDCRDFDEVRESVRGRQYEEDKRRYCDQKTSRSYDVHREGYVDDERSRRTARSEVNKDRRYDDRRYDDRDQDRRYEDIIQRDKYYEDIPLVNRDRNYSMSCKERRCKKNLDRSDRVSVASRDDEYKDKDRYSERERDSGLSVADGENSTVSGRSNYLRVVKHEISEQREAMDKMMKLWKELMRCFKGISQTQGPEKEAHESAANNARESAATQLRLWRECMRRYETVARDVGDTDARLMEEINKQRSEMSEMATMWQECLQRYRDMSTDFNNLKQKLATSESPTRAPTLATCAEGEGLGPPAPYRLPPAYPPMPPMASYGGGGSPLRSRASAPPAWWYGEPPPPRRRSSPDSGSRDRDRDRDRSDRRHRHKDRDRDDSRYKEKAKPNAARSEHRHRKR